MDCNLNENAEVVNLPFFGNSLISRKNFEPGDVVLKEKPYITGIDLTLEEAACVNEGLEYRNLVNLKTFILATLEKKQTILSTWVPTLETAARSMIYSKILKAVDAALKIWPQSHSKEVLIKVCLAFTCNAHRLEGHLPAIYLTASKLNHQCEHNVSYDYKDGYGIWICIKPIFCGEQIFASYVDDILPTVFRQLQLRQRYFFTCTCNYCTLDVDYFRQLPCSDCHKRTKKNCYLSEYDLKNIHYMQKFPNEWKCAHCNALYYKNFAPGIHFMKEQKIYFQIHCLENTCETIRLDALDGLCMVVRRTLGPCHWCTKRLEQLLCQKIYSNKDGNNLIKFKKLVNEIIEWAEQGRPGETGYQFLSFLINSAFFLLDFGECEAALKYFNIVWPWCLLLNRHIKSVEDGMKQCIDQNR